MHTFIWSLWSGRRGGRRPRRALARRVGSSHHRRTRGRPRGQALRPPAAGRPARRPRRRSRLPGQPAPPGLALRLLALAVQGRSACRWSIVPPGEIALVVAADGAAIPPERILGREVDVRQLPGRARVPARRRRDGPPARHPDRRHLPHQPGALPGRAPRQRDAASACRRDELHVLPGPARPGRHRDRRSTAGPSPPATSPARRSPATTASRTARRSSTPAAAAACRRRSLLSGSWNLNPWFVQVELMPMTEIPIGYVGVVVSYVGARARRRLGRRLHARRPGRARPQGRVGRAAAARQAPDQHARDEGGARADHQHRPQLGDAHRGAPVRRAAVADHGALEGRLRLHRSTSRRSSTSA